MSAKTMMKKGALILKKCDKVCMKKLEVGKEEGEILKLK